MLYASFFFFNLVASDGLYCNLRHVNWSVCFTTHSRQTRLMQNIQCTSIFVLRSLDGLPRRCERRTSVWREYAKQIHRIYCHCSFWTQLWIEPTLWLLTEREATTLPTTSQWLDMLRNVKWKILKIKFSDGQFIFLFGNCQDWDKRRRN